MSTDDLPALTEDELAAEGVTALPPKEVISLLDLNADIDAALDLAAPVDLAVAANANVVAPIEAAVSANVLSFGSDSAAMADQHATVDQALSGDAVAHAPQDSTLDQGAGTTDGTTPDGTVDGGAGTAVTDPTTSGTGDLSSALSGDLLKVDVNANLDADVAAPVAGAIAANANVAAPIDAAVSANIGSIDSHSAALAQQDVQLTQHLDGVTADATAAQQSDITQ